MATTRSRDPNSILSPGRTCWAVEHAERFRCIQDGADYFRLVRQAILRAEHTIFILGWDISGRTDLLPGETPTDGPTHLDDLIAFVARRRPRLRCYILVWDYGTLYTLERDPLSRYRLGWRTPRRVKFGYDDRHPFGASHHQKVVVVDDRLAFSGSLDLTGHRWDTHEHRIEEPGRITPTGTVYTPYHEVQAMMEGPVAASLGTLARERWGLLGAKKLPPVSARQDTLWPDDVEPDFTDVEVGVSRTVPGSESQPAIRECEALFLESIEAARTCIYIENQYFTSARLGEALARRLREPRGPEVVVVSPRECQGWLEKTTMGAFREAVFRNLREADLHGRLRIVFPMTSRALDVSTFIHSKVMVVDDTLLRIGSANFSNRSLGMDTECDISVEADDSNDDSVRRGIRAVRNRLLAEHFGASFRELESELEKHGSLAALIDARSTNDRTLARVEPVPESTEPTEAVRNAADPEEPVGFGPAVDQLLPAVAATDDRSHLRLWIVPATVIIAAVFAAWSSGHRAVPTELAELRSTLTSMRPGWMTVLAGGATFVVAAWCLIPVELLILVIAFVLGPLQGGVASFAGSIVAAATGYGIGRAVGPAVLSRWLNPRSYRMGRQLCAQGPGAVAVLRLATVATASSIHLLCGAGKVRFRDYIVGSVIGLLPAIIVLSVLGGLLRWTLLQPTIWSALLTIGFAVLIAAGAFAIRTFLLIRQFAPITAGHRSRAEFG